MDHPKQPTQPRLACDRCHAQKLRCIRSPNSSEQCQRCGRLGEKCTYSPPLRLGRPPRQRDSDQEWETRRRRRRESSAQMDSQGGTASSTIDKERTASGPSATTPEHDPSSSTASQPSIIVADQTIPTTLSPSQQPLSPFGIPPPIPNHPLPTPQYAQDNNHCNAASDFLESILGDGSNAFLQDSEDYLAYATPSDTIFSAVPNDDPMSMNFDPCNFQTPQPQPGDHGNSPSTKLAQLHLALTESQRFFHVMDPESFKRAMDKTVEFTHALLDILPPLTGEAFNATTGGEPQVGSGESSAASTSPCPWDAATVCAVAACYVRILANSGALAGRLRDAVSSGDAAVLRALLPKVQVGSHTALQTTTSIQLVLLIQLLRQSLREIENRMAPLVSKLMTPPATSSPQKQDRGGGGRGGYLPKPVSNISDMFAAVDDEVALLETSVNQVLSGMLDVLGNTNCL